MLSKQVQQEMLDQQGIYIIVGIFLDMPFGRINVCLLVSNTKISITLEAFFDQTLHQSIIPMADLAAGDATARQRAHVALCAGASLEEVEEARQLLDTSEEQVGGSSWQGEMMTMMRDIDSGW